MASLEEELGWEKCSTGILEVADRQAFEEASACLGEAANGRLDLLFNNAGIPYLGTFDEQSLETLTRVLEVNLKGVMIGIRAALPLPLPRATPGSLAWSVPSPGNLGLGWGRRLIGDQARRPGPGRGAPG